MFSKGSRYERVARGRLVRDGREIPYLLTRFIGKATPKLAHKVTPQERVDHLAQRYYRAPERFWRICDANLVPWPPDLVAEPGAVIHIPSSTED